MYKTLKSVARDDSGATMIEYGLIAALVSVAAITALSLLGTDLKSMFNFVAGCLTSAQAGTPCTSA